MNNTQKNADNIISLMLKMRNDEQANFLKRFFKTGKGQYGFGDKFLGIKNPDVRNVVKQFGGLELSEIQKLIDSEFHEIRLCGFLLLTVNYQKQNTQSRRNTLDSKAMRDTIIDFYIKNSHRANNWDLVDLSAPKLIGQWMVDKTLVDINSKEEIVESLAASGNLWKERISMVMTWTTTRYKIPKYAIHYAEIHLKHSHDLMHKAVGWMLREVGKRCDIEILRDFLTTHYSEMSRTTLRYAIEKMNETERKYWLNLD